MVTGKLPGRAEDEQWTLTDNWLAHDAAGRTFRATASASTGAARAMFIGVVLLAILPGVALACMIPMTISEDLSVYDRIFVGEITGIHLESYEAAKLRCENPADFYCFGSDSTPRFAIDVVVWQPIRGIVAKRETLKLGGCGVPLPSPLQFGVFFVDDDGANFAEYWDPSDRADVAKKIEELKVRLAQ